MLARDSKHGLVDYREAGFLRGYFLQRRGSAGASRRALGLSVFILALTGFVWIFIT